MDPAQVISLELRATSGDVDAMLRLAFHHEAAEDDSEAGKAIEWLKRAANSGDCAAVRLLADDFTFRKARPEEAELWRKEESRRQCGVAHWSRAADGAVHYARPDDDQWEMRIGCRGGAVEVVGPSAINAPGRMIFRTSLGQHERMVDRVQRGEHGYAAVAYRTTPADEVLQALLRGERIEAQLSGGEPRQVDGKGAATHLQRVITGCRADNRPVVTRKR